MSYIASTATPVKTISIQELRQLLESKRPIEFWNVLTDEWLKRGKHLWLAPREAGP
jgi:hypothetical protein